MNMFTLLFATSALSEFIDEPVVVDDPVVEPSLLADGMIDVESSHATLRNLYSPMYGGMGLGGGSYGMNSMLNSGAYGSRGNNYNMGRSYSNSSGWDRGYNNTNSNSYSLGGGYGSGGNFLNSGMGNYGMYYRRRLDANTEPDTIIELPAEFTNAMAVTDKDIVLGTSPVVTIDVSDDAPTEIEPTPAVGEDEEVIDGQAYRPGGGFHGPYSRGPVRQPYYGARPYSMGYSRPYGYGYPSYRPRYYRRLAEISELPSLPTYDDIVGEFVDDEPEVDEVTELIDGQTYNRIPSPISMTHPMLGVHGGHYHPMPMRGGMRNSYMNSGANGYNQAASNFNKGSTYSNETAWDRGYNNTYSNNYNQGAAQNAGGYNQFLGNGSNAAYY